MLKLDKRLRKIISLELYFIVHLKYPKKHVFAGIVNDCGLDVRNWDYQMVKDFFICAKEIANNGEPKCFDCLCTLDVITKGLGGPIPCCNGDCLCKYETYI